MKNIHQKYKSTAVTSASREKILLMLYEAAIKHVKLAIRACEEKKIADRGTNIIKAYDIIMELNNTLDHKVGGDIAKNLEQLYMFLTDQLTKANMTADVVALNNSLKVLETLYTGWQQAVEKLKKDEAAKNAPAKAGNE